MIRFFNDEMEVIWHNHIGPDFDIVKLMLGFQKPSFDHGMGAVTTATQGRVYNFAEIMDLVLCTNGDKIIPSTGIVIAMQSNRVTVRSVLGFIMDGHMVLCSIVNKCFYVCYRRGPGGHIGPPLHRVGWVMGMSTRRVGWVMGASTRHVRRVVGAPNTGDHIGSPLQSPFECVFQNALPHGVCLL